MITILTGVKCILWFFFCTFFFFLINLFIYFWLCWVFVSVRGLSLVAASRGHSSSRCAGLSLSWPLLLRSTGSRRAGPAVVAHGPSRSAACGILPDQGPNPCLLHWQADSQPLRHQGSPYLVILICISLMISDVEHLLMFLLAIWMLSLAKYLFSSSVHFWIKKFSHQIVWLLYIFGILTPYQIQIFSQKHTVFFFFFWLCCAACRILVPWPGVEPRPTAVKALSPNHWTTRELPRTTLSWLV